MPEIKYARGTIVRGSAILLKAFVDTIEEKGYKLAKRDSHDPHVGMTYNTPSAVLGCFTTGEYNFGPEGLYKRGAFDIFQLPKDWDAALENCFKPSTAVSIAGYKMSGNAFGCIPVSKENLSFISRIVANTYVTIGDTKITKELIKKIEEAL